MKDSGVEWIGEIPEEWTVSKLKYIVDTKITDGPHETPELVDEGIPFASAESVKNGIVNLDFKRGFISEENHEIFSRKVSPRKRDIFIVKSGATTGSIGIVETNEIFDIWSPLALVRADENIVNQKLLYYILLSDLFKSQVEVKWSFGTQQNIGMGVLEQIQIPFPSALTEQKAIADFLDSACARFDAAGKLIKGEIDTLKAYKKSLIYEAVTKGLEAGSELKDSGVDWIGEIPVGWEVKPIKYIFETVGSGTTPKSDNELFYDGELNWIQSGDLYQTDEVVQTSKTLTELGQQSSSALTTYEAPFIAVAMYGASIGNLAISKIDASVNQAVAVLKDDEIKVRFGKYALSASKSELINAGIGGTQPNISQLLLKNWHLPQPNLTEQQKIADYLDEKTKQVDDIIKIKEAQLSNLTKQRKSLIYDYVTGKKKLCK